MTSHRTYIYIYVLGRQGFNSSCLQLILMSGYSEKIEKIIRENAFKLRKQRPGLKFNPGLALIGFQITWPRVEKKGKKMVSDYFMQMCTCSSLKLKKFHKH